MYEQPVFSSMFFFFWLGLKNTDSKTPTSTFPILPSNTHSTTVAVSLLKLFFFFVRCKAFVGSQGVRWQLWVTAEWHRVIFLYNVQMYPSPPLPSLTACLNRFFLFHSFHLKNKLYLPNSMNDWPTDYQDNYCVPAITITSSVLKIFFLN